MKENILREAVELADWLTTEGEYRVPDLGMYGHIKTMPKPIIAALASQLISQVEVPGRIRVEANTGFTAIRNCEALKDGHTPMWVDIVAEYGPNRDENSIIACTEFLRELKEKT